MQKNILNEYDVTCYDCDALKVSQLNDCYKLCQEESKYYDFDVFTDSQNDYSLLIEVRKESKLVAFMFTSLERIGGTPAIILGFSVTQKFKESKQIIQSMIDELYSKSAISFPDEDILIVTRANDTSAYTFYKNIEDVIPRVGYTPTGEDRAWGKRIAKRFKVEDIYDEKTSFVSSKQIAPVFSCTSFRSASKNATEIMKKCTSENDSVLIFGWKSI